MNKKNTFRTGVRSKDAARLTIGFIGLLFPFVLVIGNWLIFGQTHIEESISCYYKTEMLPLFVGLLNIIAFFLIFYTGYDKIDDFLANLAGITLLGVAYCKPPCGPEINLINGIHLASALIFFLTISIYSFFIFTKSGANFTSRKKIRNIIFRISGIIMFVCLLLIVYHKIVVKTFDTPYVFWCETIGLVFFGFSWLTKAGMFFPDKIKH